MVMQSSKFYSIFCLFQLKDLSVQLRQARMHVGILRHRHRHTHTHTHIRTHTHMYSYTAAKPSFVSLSILPFLDCLIETCFLSCQPPLRREGTCLRRRDRKRKQRKKKGKEKGEEVRKRETCRRGGGGGGGEERGQGKRRDKGGERADEIPVSLSSVPGETTYMNPETSSDFMVTLEPNEHNTLLQWLRT